MENTVTIYDTVFNGYTPNSPALAIFPAVNLMVWTLSSILFRVFRGTIPLPVQILLFASLAGTATVAFLDIQGYTGRNLAIAGMVAATFLVASWVSMSSWRNASRKDVWSFRRNPVTLALRMATIVPMSIVCALPVVASYYSLEASAIMDRTMNRTAFEMRQDFRIDGGFMSPEVLARADKTITWYGPDKKDWQRDIWRLGSFDLGRVFWNMIHPDEARPAALDSGSWQIAQIGFTYGEKATAIGFPVVCEYRDGTFDRIGFMIGGSRSLSEMEGFEHIASLCPETFNPDGLPLADPRNIFPEPVVKRTPKGIEI